MNIEKKFELLGINPKIDGIFPIAKLIENRKSLDEDFDLTFEEFEKALEEQNEDLLVQLQIVLSGYDSSNIPTLSEFQQDTSERRIQIYNLLGIDNKFWDFLDALSPLKVRVKKQAIIADDSTPFEPWLAEFNSNYYLLNII